MKNQTMFLFGATGFVGRSTVHAALRAGWIVKAAARSTENERQLTLLGAEPVPLPAADPSAWARALRGAAVVIDLIQPPLPARIGQGDIRRVAAERLAITETLLAALEKLPAAERPLFISVSGLDDLEPDAQGKVSADSPLRSKPVGFAHIGVPVRRRIETAAVASSFVYLGTVYGPGKTFAASVFPQLAAGKFKIAGTGRNRMPLVHVDDAARALVHLAGLPRTETETRTFILTDGSLATLSDFMNHAAELMAVKRPASVPRWLASLVAGRILVEVISRDVPAEPAVLLQTGFQFRYPSFREGLPPTLAKLGYLGVGAKDADAAPTRPRPSAGKLWALLIAVIAVVALMNGLDFPLSVPHLAKMAEGRVILDARFHYTPAEVYQLLDALQESGRSAYLTLLWTLDLILPALFSWFLYVLWSRGTLARYRWVGLAGGFADYLENVAITVLLLRYPVHTPGWAGVAAIFTTAKVSLYLLGAGFGLAGLSFGSGVKSGRRKRLHDGQEGRTGSGVSNRRCLPGEAWRRCRANKIRKGNKGRDAMMGLTVDPSR